MCVYVSVSVYVCNGSVCMSVYVSLYVYVCVMCSCMCAYVFMCRMCMFVCIYMCNMCMYVVCVDMCVYVSRMCMCVYLFVCLQDVTWRMFRTHYACVLRRQSSARLCQRASESSRQSLCQGKTCRCKE